MAKKTKSTKVVKYADPVDAVPRPLYLQIFWRGLSHGDPVGSGQRMVVYEACDGRTLLCKPNVPNAESVKLLLDGMQLVAVHGCTHRVANGWLEVAPRALGPATQFIQICRWGVYDKSVPLVPADRLVEFQNKRRRRSSTAESEMVNSKKTSPKHKKVETEDSPDDY